MQPLQWKWWDGASDLDDLSSSSVDAGTIVAALLGPISRKIARVAADLLAPPEWNITGLTHNPEVALPVAVFCVVDLAASTFEVHRTDAGRVGKPADLLLVSEVLPRNTDVLSIAEVLLNNALLTWVFPQINAG